MSILVTHIGVCARSRCHLRGLAHFYICQGQDFSSRSSLVGVRPQANGGKTGAEGDLTRRIRAMLEPQFPHPMSLVDGSAADDGCAEAEDDVDNDFRLC